MPSIIILDFDKTLFDSDAFRNALSGIFLVQGISSEDFSATYWMSRARKPQWTPEQQIKLLIEKYNNVNSSNLIREIDSLCAASERFLYSDTIDFLAELKGAGHELHVLSFGDEHIQTEKINGCGIVKYLSSVRVTPNTDKSLELSKYLGNSARLSAGSTGSPQAIFIDDNQDILRSVKIRYPSVVTILMSRDGVGHSNVGACVGDNKICFTGIDYEVSSLKQAQKIIDIKNRKYSWMSFLWRKITKTT